MLNQKEKIPKLKLIFPEGTEHLEEKRQYCTYLMEGATKKDAAGMMGKDRKTIWNWEQQDSTFSTWVKASILFFKHSLIKDLAFGYKKEPLEVLKARYPEEWNTVKTFAVFDPERELKKTLAILEGEDIDLTEEQGEDNTGIPQLPAGSTEQPQNQG